MIKCRIYKEFKGYLEVLQVCIYLNVTFY